MYSHIIFISEQEQRSYSVMHQNYFSFFSFIYMFNLNLVSHQRVWEQGAKKNIGNREGGSKMSLDSVAYWAL
jgi:hypothetical protein